MKLENSSDYKAKCRQALIEMTLNTASNSDRDLLDLMKYYNLTGILDQNEYLLAQLRQYVDDRFHFMGRALILEYCNFLKDMGMFFQDSEMIVMLQNYFKSNYYDFELTEIFQLMKLNAYCFYKSDDFMQSLQDSVGIRIKEE